MLYLWILIVAFFKEFIHPCLNLYLQLEEESIERHRGERKVHGVEEDSMSVTDSIATESDLTADTDSVTIDTDSNSDSDSEDDNNSENGKESDRVQESESRKSENKSESRTEGSDNGCNEDNTADDKEEEEVGFPDTSISLQHVQGDKWVLASLLNLNQFICFTVNVLGVGVAYREVPRTNAFVACCKHLIMISYTFS